MTENLTLLSEKFQIIRQIMDKFPDKGIYNTNNYVSVPLIDLEYDSMSKTFTELTQFIKDMGFNVSKVHVVKAFTSDFNRPQGGVFKSDVRLVVTDNKEGMELFYYTGGKVT